MSRGVIASEAPAGGDRFCLDQFAIIQGLVTATTYPGGDSVATWQMTLDMRAQHRAWTYGRKIKIAVGASEIWHGFLDNPTRDTVWSMTAYGLPSTTKQYVALAASDNNALNLDEVIDAAIARGMPLTRSGTFPSMPPVAGGSPVTAPSGSQMIDDSLDQVATAQTSPTYWTTTTQGVMTMGAAPTVPSYILYATGVGGGRSVAGMVTDAFVMYQSASGVLSVDQRSAASRPFGRFEQVLDETTLGLIPSTTADTLGDAFLARNPASAKYTSTFTVTPGQLVTMGGVAVDLATVRAGFLANVIVTDPDSAGDVALAAIPNVLMGQTSYDWDADVLTLTPVYSAQDSLSALLGAGSGT